MKITTEQEYRKSLGRIEELWNVHEESEEAKELTELVSAVEEYEEQFKLEFEDEQPVQASYGNDQFSSNEGIYFEGNY